MAKKTMKVFLRSSTAQVPILATAGSAGYDLFADDDIIVPAFDQAIIDTGISLAIPAGHCGQIWPRSGLELKFAIGRGAGLIDSDYRGPIKVLLINRADRPYPVRVGDRIAQLVIVPVVTSELSVVESLAELESTQRGEGGFGHTGR